jgi:adenylate kinase
MILRLIINEFTTRGWLKDGTPRPYSLYSSPINMFETDGGADGSPDAVFVPSGSQSAQYTYSDHPSASFILDGFPRTAVQALQLDELIPMNMVVNIDTPHDIIMDRICNRWVHAPSGRVYNTTFNPPKVPGLDDVTGEPLTRREDDDPETWKARLKNFKETSEPLLEHYKLGVLLTVTGKTSNEITPKVLELFKKKFGVLDN